MRDTEAIAIVVADIYGLIDRDTLGETKLASARRTVTSLAKTGHNDETYHFAKVSGDQAYLNWLCNRLVNVYGEDENTDFVLTLKYLADHYHEIIKETP